MRHNRNACLHDALHGFGDMPATFKLHGLRAAFLEKPTGVANRIGSARLVAHEWQVADDVDFLSARTTA